MKNRSIIAIFIIVFVGISLIITIPILTLSIGISPYHVIDETDDSFIYAPSTSSPIENLNVEAEYANIEIKYVSPLVDYYAMIEVNIEMSGKNLAGKNYKDFFDANLDFTNSSPSFIMAFKANIDKLEVLPLIKNLTIIVNLRSGIIFDLNITLEKGNVGLFVPFRMPINNVIVNVSNGNIFYDFNYCIIEGNITGIVNEGNIFYDFKHCKIDGNIIGIANAGDIVLKSTNVKYIRNSSWTFEIENGDFEIYIYQYEDLGANITSMAKISDGGVFILYEDNSANIGARFEIPYGYPFLNMSRLPDCLYRDELSCAHQWMDGFHHNDLTSQEKGRAILTSLDLLEKSVKNYYNMTIEMSFSHIDLLGFFDIDLVSIN